MGGLTALLNSTVSVRRTSVHTRGRFTLLVSMLGLAGCFTFQYGDVYTRPAAVPTAATVVLYRHDTAALAPAGKAPLPYEINGIPSEKALNPHSYTVLLLPPGKTLFNAKTGLIDLRRESMLEPGQVYYAKASCYYVLTEAFCKIEVVPSSVGEAETRQLRESVGHAAR